MRRIAQDITLLLGRECVAGLMHSVHQILLISVQVPLLLFDQKAALLLNNIHDILLHLQEDVQLASRVRSPLPPDNVAEILLVPEQILRLLNDELPPLVLNDAAQVLLIEEELPLLLPILDKFLPADETPEVLLLPEDVQLLLLDAGPPLLLDYPPEKLLRAEGIGHARQIPAGEDERPLDDVAQVFLIAEQVPLLLSCQRAAATKDELPQVALISKWTAPAVGVVVISFRRCVVVRVTVVLMPPVPTPQIPPSSKSLMVVPGPQFEAMAP